MPKFVVDTNVPIVANARDGAYDLDCILATIDRLRRIREGETVVLDFAGNIIAEYKKYLSPAGQPGVGDSFYQHILRNIGNEARVALVALEVDGNGDYKSFPSDHRLKKFDQSDRKFAVAAISVGAVVVNAVDSDWLEYRDALKDNGIVIEFVCGEDICS